MVSTVFVVDDDAEVRESIAALMTAMGIRAAIYETGEDFLAAFDPAMRGCLVTDLRLRGLNGIELLDKLVERNYLLPTIIITAFPKTYLTVRALRHGAITLMEKPFDEDELWSAIREALALDEKIREQEAQHTELRGRFAKLSDSEKRVLDMVVAGQSNCEIAGLLKVSVRTVEARRHSIFEKTGTKSVVDLVRLTLLYELSSRNSKNITGYPRHTGAFGT